ncbi:MAG: hypothetical protein O3A74_05285 [archaeon]|nr:hypothetical protein [archaeon]MDA0842537.1 hypothetical protein [archaeon]
MKKALAQNPNLLRTLLGLSFTLIFLLAYAVYGATISPSYYLYQTNSIVDTIDGDANQSYYNEEINQTTWTWHIAADPYNLTWVNVSAEGLSSSATLRILNSAGVYSHPSLGIKVHLSGNPSEEFVCSIECSKNTVHEKQLEEGDSLFIATLTDPNPARRSNGTVHASSLEEAESKARELITNTHLPSIYTIEVIEFGNRTTQPSISIETVNEEFGSIALFQIDAATEFLWALAAVIGCFAMVLVPSFTVYFAARSKEKKNEEKVRLSQEMVNVSVSSSEQEQEE